MVVIKNAVVPPSCYFCPMTNDGFYLCKANNPHRMLEDDCEERRPDWCPLVPVPPHGRLIDADEFLKRAIGTKCFRGDYALMLEKLVGESTTIIPAEEGET